MAGKCFTITDANLGHIADYRRGASLIGYVRDASGAAGRSVYDSLTETVSVKDFGAVGDGVADDTAAIYRALAYVKAIGSGTVYLPAGDYKVSNIVMGVDSDGYSDVRLQGAGMGVTTIYGYGTNGEETVRLVDCVRCQVTDLTIDSSNCPATPAPRGGIRLYCCQECLLERVEVNQGGHQSIHISGYQWFGTLACRDNRVSHCIARNQRYWSAGTSAAQIIAANGAIRTIFDHCTSIAEDFAGDLFDADYAQFTYFIGCVAMGNDSPAGFWSEGEQAGRHPVAWIGCIARDCDVGISVTQNVLAQVEGCQFYDIAGAYGIRCAGLRHSVSNCLFDTCCQTNSELASGGIVVEKGYTTIDNCHFANSTYNNINIYCAPGGSGLEYTVAISNCVFDKDVYLYGTAGPNNVMIRGCRFGTDAEFRTYEGHYSLITLQGNTFLDKGLTISRARWLMAIGNIFRGIDSYAGEAISTATDNANGIIRHNVFADYSANVYANSVGDGTAFTFDYNRFEDCGATQPGTFD